MSQADRSTIPRDHRLDMTAAEATAVSIALRYVINEAEEHPIRWPQHLIADLKAVMNR